MRKLSMWKVALIGIVAFLAVSYGVYAVMYQGNYNVTVTGTGTGQTWGTVTITNVEVESEACGVLEFIDALRGHKVDLAMYNFTMYAELERASDTYTGIGGVILMPTPSDWSVTVRNVPAGTYDLHLTIIQDVTGETCWEQTLDVVVGP